MTDYINHLNYHNFLKLLISEDVKKLNQELEFLAPFTKLQNQTQQVKENLGTLIDANSLFKDIFYEAKIIIYEAEELFSSFVAKTKIFTIDCFGKNSKNLKTLFTELFNAYKNKANIENSKNNDKYYFDDTEKNFIGFKTDTSTKTIPYDDVEHYTKKMWVDQQKGRKLGYENEYKPEGFYMIAVIPKIVKLEDAPHTCPVIKTKNVTKNKDVPEYQDIPVKKFNDTKYNEDINNINTTINDLKLNINEILNQLKAINITKKCNLSLDYK